MYNKMTKNQVIAVYKYIFQEYLLVWKAIFQYVTDLKLSIIERFGLLHFKAYNAGNISYPETGWPTNPLWAL